MGLWATSKWVDSPVGKIWRAEIDGWLAGWRVPIFFIVANERSQWTIDLSLIAGIETNTLLLLVGILLVL